MLTEKLSREMMECVSKLFDEERLKEYSNQEALSLSGLCGVLPLMGVCKEEGLEGDVNSTSHRLIESLCDQLKEGSYALSLHGGFSSLLACVYLCSARGEQYESLLTTLCNHLESQVTRQYIIPMQRAIDNQSFLSSSMWNLADGLVGIITALSFFDGQRQLYSHCVNVLIDYLDRDVTLPFGIVPGWYLPQEHSLSPQEAYKYQNGSYVLSQSLGITGALAALVDCVNSDPKNTRALTALKKIAVWLKERCHRVGNSYQIPIVVSIEEVRDHQYVYQLNRDTWYCGIPSTALSLYRAGKVLEDGELCDFAEDLYISLFNKEMKDWNHFATSLFHGRAGILLTTYYMAKHTGSDYLMQQCQMLERDLMRFYNPAHPFGFQCVEVSPSGSYTWKDDPSFLFGAAGVTLALLRVGGIGKVNWERLLLIN